MNYLGFFIEIKLALDGVLADPTLDSQMKDIIKQKVHLALSDINPFGLVDIIKFLEDQKLPLPPLKVPSQNLFVYGLLVQFWDDGEKFSEFVLRRLDRKSGQNQNHPRTRIALSIRNY